MSQLFKIMTKLTKKQLLDLADNLNTNYIDQIEYFDGDCLRDFIQGEFKINMTIEQVWELEEHLNSPVMAEEVLQLIEDAKRLNMAISELINIPDIDEKTLRKGHNLPVTDKCPNYLN